MTSLDRMISKAAASCEPVMFLGGSTWLRGLAPRLYLVKDEPCRQHLTDREWPIKLWFGHYMEYYMSMRDYAHENILNATGRHL